MPKNSPVQENNTTHPHQHQGHFLLNCPFGANSQITRSSAEKSDQQRPHLMIPSVKNMILPLEPVTEEAEPIKDQFASFHRVFSEHQRTNSSATIEAVEVSSEVEEELRKMMHNINDRLISYDFHAVFVELSYFEPLVGVDKELGRFLSITSGPEELRDAYEGAMNRNLEFNLPGRGPIVPSKALYDVAFWVSQIDQTDDWSEHQVETNAHYFNTWDPTFYPVEREREPTLNEMGQHLTGFHRDLTEGVANTD